MASADYWLCDVCDAKTFYDVVLHYDALKDGAVLRPGDDKVLPSGVGDMAAICVKCAETHEVIWRPKVPVVGDLTEASLLGALREFNSRIASNPTRLHITAEGIEFARELARRDPTFKDRVAAEFPSLVGLLTGDQP